MPLYEYHCQSCGHRFEVIQKFSDVLVSVCPNCGKGPVVKLMSSPAIQFKGTGWYITDYARKDSGKGGGAKDDSKGEGKSDGKSEAKSQKSESNSDSSSERKGDSKSSSDSKTSSD